jgi:hypothetical protein
MKFLCLFICIYTTQGWKTCKWLEIRDKTPELKFALSSSIRFWKYIQVREMEDAKETEMVEDLNKMKDAKEIERAIAERTLIDKEKRKSKRYDSGNLSRKVKKHNSHISTLIILAA